MDHIKIITAGQVKIINAYKNSKIKLMKCCANIYFNKQCIAQKITPAYAKIKVAKTSPASTITQQKAQVMRVKDEIKFLTDGLKMAS
jgi:hypothetical protein